MSAVTTPERVALDVHAALHAICSTGKGRCWYCDLKLPLAEKAITAGWDVQRVQKREPVASIILVCPSCLRQKAKLGEDEFLRGVSLRVCNATC